MAFGMVLAPLDNPYVGRTPEERKTVRNAIKEALPYAIPIGGVGGIAAKGLNYLRLAKAGKLAKTAVAAKELSKDARAFRYLGGMPRRAWDMVKYGAKRGAHLFKLSPLAAARKMPPEVLSRAKAARRTLDKSLRGTLLDPLVRAHAANVVKNVARNVPTAALNVAKGLGNSVGGVAGVLATALPAAENALVPASYLATKLFGPRAAASLLPWLRAATVGAHAAAIESTLYENRANAKLDEEKTVKEGNGQAEQRRHDFETNLVSRATVDAFRRSLEGPAGRSGRLGVTFDDFASSVKRSFADSAQKLYARPEDWEPYKQQLTNVAAQAFAGIEGTFTRREFLAAARDRTAPSDLDEFDRRRAAEDYGGAVALSLLPYVELNRKEKTWQRRKP